MNQESRYTFEMPMKVRDYEVDSQGIVNNANYLHYLEHTRHEFCESRGVSFRDLQRKGVDPVVSKIEISYLRPLRLAEKMVSALWLERRGARFIFHQDIFNEARQHVVKALVTIVSTANGRLSRGEELAAAFAGSITNVESPK